MTFILLVRDFIKIELLEDLMLHYFLNNREHRAIRYSNDILMEELMFYKGFFEVPRID